MLNVVQISHKDGIEVVNRTGFVRSNLSKKDCRVQFPQALYYYLGGSDTVPMLAWPVWYTRWSASSRLKVQIATAQGREP